MLDLTLNIGIGVNSFVSIPGLITAVSAPTMGSGLFEGQSIQDSEDFSSLTSTANYSSTTGEIISVVASPTGDAASISAPLSEGDLAGYQGDCS